MGKEVHTLQKLFKTDINRALGHERT
jgi:hypothetical protein